MTGSSGSAMSTLGIEMPPPMKSSQTPVWPSLVHSTSVFTAPTGSPRTKVGSSYSGVASVVSMFRWVSSDSVRVTVPSTAVHPSLLLSAAGTASMPQPPRSVFSAMQASTAVCTAPRKAVSPSSVRAGSGHSGRSAMVRTTIGSVLAGTKVSRPKPIS